MRISKRDQVVIKETCKEFFGNADVYLFGSRLDDTARGGDIDLFIVPDTTIQTVDYLEKKIQFLTRLKQRIGDQKIDVILAKKPELPIEQEARTHGVKL